MSALLGPIALVVGLSWMYGVRIRELRRERDVARECEAFADEGRDRWAQAAMSQQRENESLRRQIRTLKKLKTINSIVPCVRFGEEINPRAPLRTWQAQASISEWALASRYWIEGVAPNEVRELAKECGGIVEELIIEAYNSQRREEEAYYGKHREGG